MTITLTEVDSAITRCEPLSGLGALDTTKVSVTRGDLLVLIEAAKRAQYRDTFSPIGGAGGGNSDFVLVNQ